MKKYFCPALFGIFIIFTIIGLNINVTTQQCIDHSCHAIRLPLYLKTLDFFDRHYNYKQLVKRIIKDAKNKDDTALKILEWTSANIRKSPEGFPVIDDHIWYTIVRGHAVDDQFQDIFTTLCNYAGLEASFCWLLPKDSSGRRPFSFVKLSRGWAVFDAYKGVYFKNKEGQVANLEDFSNGNWKTAALADKAAVDDYTAYLSNISAISLQGHSLSRSSIQSPFRRFLFWLNSKSGFSH